MLRTNILLLFFVTSAGALMHENVFFHRMGGFSMSRSKWLVLFVNDLSTYERFLDRLTRDINKVAIMTDKVLGAQWLSGRVLDSRQKGRGFEPHRRHCVVVLEQDTFILA